MPDQRERSSSTYSVLRSLLEPGQRSADETPFTARSLEILFEKERVWRPTGPYRLPTSAALAELADNLNALKLLLKNQKGAWRVSQNLSVTARRNIESLLRVIPLLLEENRECKRLVEQRLALAGTSIAARLSDKINSFTRLIEVLTEVRTRENFLGVLDMFPPVKPVSGGREWHRLIDALAECFRETVLPIRADHPFGLSGQVFPRFVAAVVPRLTDECPTPGSVKRFISATRSHRVASECLPASKLPGELAKLGGVARSRNLTPERRVEIARIGAAARWDRRKR